MWATRRCRGNAQRAYNSTWRITGLGKGLGEIAKHSPWEVVGHLVGGPAGAAISLGAVGVVAAPAIKESWSEYWDLTTRMRLCGAAFGPR